MGEVGNGCGNLVDELVGKCPLGRTRRRKVDLKETDCDDTSGEESFDFCYRCDDWLLSKLLIQIA
jgi:hypothetical protein